MPWMHYLILKKTILCNCHSVWWWTNGITGAPHDGDECLSSDVYNSAPPPCGSSHSGLWPGGEHQWYISHTLGTPTWYPYLLAGVGRCGRDGRQGRAIMYRYPRSVISGVTSEAMHYLLSSSEEKKACLRQSVLRHLMLPGMDGSLLETCNNIDGCCCVCHQAHVLNAW